LLSPAVPGQTLIVTTEGAPPERVAALRAAGAEIITVPARCGKVDIRSALFELGARGINSVLVEGGGRVLGSLFDAGLVDRVVAFVAPVLVGGSDAPIPLAGRGVETMEQAVRLRDVRIRELGTDVVIEGRVRPVEIPE